MTQLNPELFTSFQSALDALEQLAIITDTNSSDEPKTPITSGDLESIPVELKLRVLHLSNLETCVALSESCDSYRQLWKSLDKGLVRGKVLFRVPWMQLNEGSTGLTTWRECAKLVVNRTKDCLSGDHDCILTKSTELLHTQNLVSHIRVDPTDVTFDEDTRRKMNPIFANEFVQTPTGQFLQGTRLRHGVMTIEMKTLIADRGTSDAEDEWYPPIQSKVGVVKSPFSELRLKHVTPGYKVAVAHENYVLMHIRYSTDRPPEGADVAYDDPRAMVDGVIHKESHPRDSEGCLIIDPATLIMQQTRDDESMPLINLLPGNGGAIIARFSPEEEDGKNTSSLLQYIEPTPELRHVILCAVPFPQYGGFNGFDHHHQKFCVFYNGFLFYLHEGRFLRLWVDLGYQKQLKLSDKVKRAVGHDTLVQKTTTRCLTAINTTMPMVGTLALHQNLYGIHGVVQGDKNQAMDRFVTLMDAWGASVGDLLTGKTYFCKVSKKGYQTVIPYISNKKKKTVGFYSFSPLISYQLHSSVVSLYKEGMRHMDLNGLFAHYLQLARQHNINDISKYKPVVSRLEREGHFKDDFYLCPRRVGATYAFKDSASEFTNIENSILELQEDKDTDTDDWDCGHGTGRDDDEHHVDVSDGEDSDNGLSPAQLRNKHNGKLPSLHYKKGKSDGLKGRRDTRYDKQDYYKGYHEAVRRRFGFTDPNDKDDYWGSNPKHGKWYLS